jgi:16S rRNA processing protein RimM
MTSAKPTSSQILLGAITGAHGIKGEVVIKTFTAAPDDIGAYGALSDENGTRSFEIESLRVTAKGVLARLSGVNDRTAAEALRGVALYVPRDRLPKVEDAEYYHADLVGLAAVDADGKSIGTIIAVENFGAGDLLEIRRDGQKDTDYVPFTDACVPEVDLAQRRVVIVMPVMVGDKEPDEG